MFAVYAGEQYIYDDSLPSEGNVLISPKLSMEKNSTGQLTFTMPPTNIGYDSLELWTTTMAVYRNGTKIFEGRPISESRDFWKNRQITCEGCLGYLNDTLMGKVTKTTLAYDWLEVIIYEHNKHANSSRQFEMGKHFGTSSLYPFSSEYETCLEALNSMINDVGGYINVRYEDGKRYLDYFDYTFGEYYNYNDQTIEFGKNLTDFTQDWDVTDIVTAVLPIGGTLTDTEGNTLVENFTIAGTEESDDIYVTNSTTMAEYGWVASKQQWDVGTVSDLKSKAQSYLSNLQFNTMTITVKAVDLGYLLNDDLEYVYEHFKLYDYVQVISDPHGLNKYFPITKVEIPLDEPQNTTYSLGEKSQGSSSSSSLTSSANSKTSTLLSEITEAQRQSNSFLKAAKENAANILNTFAHGYVTIVTDDNGAGEAIYISDNADYTQAQKLWRWNVNGLGYSSSGYNGEYSIALTNDGQISADMITTGLMNADRIRLSDNMTVYYISSGGYSEGGLIGYGLGQDEWGSSTKGIHLVSAGAESEVIATTEGARISYSNGANVNVTADGGQLWMKNPNGSDAVYVTVDGNTAKMSYRSGDPTTGPSADVTVDGNGVTINVNDPDSDGDGNASKATQMSFSAGGISIISQQKEYDVIELLEAISGSIDAINNIDEYYTDIKNGDYTAKFG